MHICIFEDEFSAQFSPLNLLRPVFDLRCGILTLRERIVRHIPADTVTLGTRDYLVPLVKEENPGLDVNTLPEAETSCLFVNGRSVMTAELAREIRKQKGEFVILAGGTVVTARLTDKNLRFAGRSLLAGDPSAIPGSVRRIERDSRLVSFPWDLVYANETEILNDFLLLTHGGSRVRKGSRVHQTAVLENRELIHIGKKSDVGPFVHLDASEGPIHIGERAVIHSHSVVRGPVSIGDGSLVKSGSRIGEFTTIGPVCKVAGEIEHSILLSYANKQHDGYLGHSYLASWVNLGAGTTTSNLKNTYGTINAAVGGRQVDTGRMFLGLIAGDHVKTGINATLDTGTVIGIMSNIYGTAIPPKNVPAFSWGSGSSLGRYDLEKGVAVARKVMARRSITASDAYQEIIRTLYERTDQDT